MKIKSVIVNTRKKTIEIETPKGILGLPFAKLRVRPTTRNRLATIYVDPELGRSAVTYRLASGQEDSVHIDAFLDYNRDPEFFRKITGMTWGPPPLPPLGWETPRAKQVESGGE